MKSGDVRCSTFCDQYFLDTQKHVSYTAAMKREILAKMAKVLLVEPDYRTEYLPLGLQKIASYHLSRNNEVKYVKGTPKEYDGRPSLCGNAYYPDVIYITSLFTYTGRTVIHTIQEYQKRYPKAKIKVGGVFATLMSDYVKRETGITPHRGLLAKVERCIPDYSCFPDSRKTVLFTSRGCPRKCKFCAVKELEDFHIIKNWKNHINLDKDHIVIQDNNILSASWEHQVDVVNHLAKFKGKRIEFNGGFDCFRFKEKNAELYSKLSINPIRFAFDEIKQDGHIQKAIELARKYHMGNDYTVYILHNFHDRPEEFYYRVKEMIKLNASAYPMRYTPLDWLDKKYVGEYWTEQQLQNLNNLIRHNSWGRIIIFGRFKLKDFERIYGRDEQEFVDIISHYHETKVYELQKKRYPSTVKKSNQLSLEVLLYGGSYAAQNRRH